MAEVKRKTYTAKPTFGDTAPSNTIPFPEKANMTIAEILAFFPNSINCVDVIYRMISNGGTRKAIHAIINTFRDFEADWSANCCGEAMYKTMDRAGYIDWTITKHDLWHESRKASWDANRLDVGELRVAALGVPVGNVSFRGLAENVRTMPEGDDALDLTRMVQYCVQNSEDGWEYPKDYEELLELLGGPTEVREPNVDGAVFRRWENRKAPPPTPRPAPPSAGVELLAKLKQTRRRVSDPRRRPTAGRRPRTVSPGPGSLMQRMAAKETAKKTTESAVDVGEMSGRRLDESNGTAYRRGLAEYAPLPSPPGITSTPTSLTVVRIFQAEGPTGETDAYSAYAFGGPRRTPPYRRLEQIELPHPWDASGWAENLRWAFEQRVLFAREFPAVLDWTESPEHMAHIERVRTQRVWASDELLEQLLEGD
ncbi:uncharacterized protein M421DRAFT_93591 [Didymella exigua CBS 183.55]|uniref:Uncharacterized protein n=1 Tax=Didymella exigua CBS 183.55 TaxID=1150837 RepID=A0A6A5RFF6_9PLEO|nr:uncharacterized protein M421DRAFT_93591 [Didymella exigua CBS 183.55]KAF1927021.1 hypothetical protein M421DRAFT_93591 [Didymella exigua CBS 183.55]